MQDEELRALVREAIERHLALRPEGLEVQSPRPSAHPSHVRLALPSGSDGDGPCLIEPRVGCNHCGYCQSYGH